MVKKTIIMIMALLWLCSCASIVYGACLALGKGWALIAFGLFLMTNFFIALSIIFKYEQFHDIKHMIIKQINDTDRNTEDSKIA